MAGRPVRNASNSLNVGPFICIHSESKLTYQLLKVCKSPERCVFVRVVDTCAGCAPGSKHVDLTKAAFGQLASFEEGVLTVQLRGATEPEGW